MTSHNLHVTVISIIKLVFSLDITKIKSRKKERREPEKVIKEYRSD